MEPHNFALEQDLVKNQINPVIVKEKAHLNSIECVSVHPDQKVIASGSHDHTIKLWDAETLKESMTLSDHKEGVWCLNHSFDGNVLISGSPDKWILVWDSKKSSLGSKLQAHTGKVYSTSFANKSAKQLVSCGEFGEVFFWDLSQPKAPIKSIKLPYQVIYSVSWSTNNDFVFATTLGSNIVVLDARSYELIAKDQFDEMEDSHSQAVCVQKTQSGDRIYCASQKGHIFWYEFHFATRKLKRLTDYKAHLDSCRSINHHPQKSLMLTSSRDGSVRLWDDSDLQHDPRVKANLVLHKENVTGIAFLGVNHVVTGSWDERLALWNIDKI